MGTDHRWSWQLAWPYSVLLRAYGLGHSVLLLLADLWWVAQGLGLTFLTPYDDFKESAHGQTNTSFQ